MKLAIWIITIIGILPVLFLSATQVHLHLVKQRQLFSKSEIQDKPDFVWVSFKPSFKTGPFKYQSLTLTHMVWPGVISLLGILFVFIGLFFLIPKQVTVVEKNGFKELNCYLEKLLGSNAPFTTLGIYTLDDKNGFSAWKKEGLVTIHLSAQLIPNDGKEDKIVSFFDCLGITPTSDYKFQNGEIKDSARSFTYPIEANLERVTDVCMRIMKEIFDISEQEGLKYHLDKE